MKENKMSDKESYAVSDNQKTIIDIAVDSWRFSRIFLRALSKMDEVDASRYMSQLKYYLEKLEQNLETMGVKLVNLEGHPYDSGMAVKALNIEDFSSEDALLIEQMLEPVIMGDEGLLRQGTVMLQKVNQ